MIESKFLGKIKKISSTNMRLSAHIDKIPEYYDSLSNVVTSVTGNITGAYFTFLDNQTSTSAPFIAKVSIEHTTDGKNNVYTLKSIITCLAGLPGIKSSSQDVSLTLNFDGGINNILEKAGYNIINPLDLTGSFYLQDTQSGYCYGGPFQGEPKTYINYLGGEQASFDNFMFTVTAVDRNYTLGPYFNANNNLVSIPTTLPNGNATIVTPYSDSIITGNVNNQLLNFNLPLPNVKTLFVAASVNNKFASALLKS